MYTNSTYTSEREVTLEDIKMHGNTPRHEDEVQVQEDLVTFELIQRLVYLDTRSELLKLRMVKCGKYSYKSHFE